MSYRVFDLKNREWVDPDKILISCGENRLLTCGNVVLGWQKLKELPENRYLYISKSVLLISCLIGSTLSITALAKILV